MKIIRNLELEWKLLIVAGILFCAIVWPLQDLFISRIDQLLLQSYDVDLEARLRDALDSSTPPDTAALISSITRSRQWKVMIPVILREQKQAVVIFSIVLVGALFLFSWWILKRLTQPLRNLASAVRTIGEGGHADIAVVSGGALGTLEKELSRMQDELYLLRERFRLQGMEIAWQEIARVMAHEIKNPLTPIRLTLDTLEEKNRTDSNLSPEDITRYIGRINSQVDNLEKLVDQFRSFSKEPESHPENLSVKQTLTGVADALESQLQITVDGDAEIVADPLLMGQVFLNVLKNSLEAESTEVEVLIKDGGAVTVTFTDNGSGIPPDKLARVWLPYVSYKKGGSGLGLPVVRKIVESMQGSVTLSSRKDLRGAQLVLTLPSAIEKRIHDEI